MNLHSKQNPRAVEGHPSTRAPFSDAGLELLRAGKLEEAASFFRSAVEKSPTSIKNLRGLLTALTRSKKHREALDIVNQLRELAPLDPHYAKSQGTLYRHLEEHAKAAEAFDQAVKLGLNDAATLRLLANALEKSRNTSEAIAAARLAVDLQPEDLRAKLNLGRILLENGRKNEARILYQHLTGSDMASDFRPAVATNASPADMAIVVQAFIKIDTLQDLCASLLKCRARNQFHLLFVVDSTVGSMRFAERNAENNAVVEWISEFIAANSKEFRSISFHHNETNQGTCRTCRQAVERAFEIADFVIFSEDDVVFSKDALEWFVACQTLPEWVSSDIWAIAGESRFFDSRQVIPDDSLKAWGATYASSHDCLNKYQIVSWIPSSCFATDKAKWAKFGHLRGQPNGDADAGRAFVALQKGVLYPIVARAKDKGMQHSSGYSVALKGVTRIKNIKNTYVMSDDVPGPDLALSGVIAYSGNLRELREVTVTFERSGKLIGAEGADTADPNVMISDE